MLSAHKHYHGPISHLATVPDTTHNADDKLPPYSKSGDESPA
jgi:hypothetical protein